MRTLEARVYASQFSSGLFEVFVGLGLVMMGLAWLADLVAVSAMVPMLLLVMWPAATRRLTGARSGSATFSAARRRRERRGLWALVSIGCAGLVLGVVALLIGIGDGFGVGRLVAGLPLALLALGAGLAAIVFGLGRLAWSALGLALASCATAIVGLDPGWSFVAAGVAFLSVGSVTVARFAATHPRIEGER